MQSVILFLEEFKLQLILYFFFPSLLIGPSIDYQLCSRLSVPVVTSLYLLCRVWWVLSIMERVGVTQTSSSNDLGAAQENITQESTDSIVNLDNNNDRWGCDYV